MRVSINTSANSLTPATYTDTVAFVNTTNGAGDTTRTVELTVRDPNQPIPLPLGSSLQVYAQVSPPLLFETTLPEGLSNFFVLLQKDSSWGGTVEVYYAGNLLKTVSGHNDWALHIPAPTPGTYIIKVTGNGSGVIKAVASLPELTLGEWIVGTIYRSWGSAWYQLHVPEGQSLLSVAVETIGLWSRLEIFHGALWSTQRWNATGDRMNLQINSPSPGMYYVHLTDSAWIEGSDQRRDHMIKVDTKPLESPPCLKPVIASFSPTRGGTAGPVTITLNGQCFDPNATVCLEREGYDEVCADTIFVSENQRTVTATFNLSAVEPGEWKLVARNPDCQIATASSRFVVRTGGESKLWVEITGRKKLRLGRWQTYVIRLANSGDIDGGGVIVIHAPNGTECFFDYGQPPEASYPYIIDTTPAILYAYMAPGGKRDITMRVRLFSNRQSHIKLNVEDEDLKEIEAEFKKKPWPIRKFWEMFIKDQGEIIYYVLRGNGFNVNQDEVLNWTADAVAWYAAKQISNVNVIQNPADITNYILTGPLNERKEELLRRKPKEVNDDQLEDINELPLSDEDRFQVELVTSISPEDKYGPTGYDAEGTSPEDQKRYIRGDGPLTYKIDFWNKEDAPAPTQDVYITDDLDPNLDWNSFTFTEFGFLKWKVPLEPGQYFNVDVDLRPDMDLIVNVEGTYDPTTGKIRWEFHSLDPITREPPEDPMAGFLPPITDSGYEIGWVTFSVNPKPGLPTGTEIRNQAWVKFDVDVFKPAPPNPDSEIPGFGPYLNTIDSGAPTSSVCTLSTTQTSKNFLVTWAGNDDEGGSGIKDYDIYVSDDGGPYTLWLTTSNTSATFSGEFGRQYSFYSRARDNVGNLEDPPSPLLPDATTMVGVPDISVTPLSFDFGDVNVGVSSEKVFVVKNEGSAELTLGVIGSPSAPFSRVEGTCAEGSVLAPSSTCTVIIGFSPSSIGSFGSSFEIPSDDPDENPVTVNLSGTGVVPDITVDPSSINFGKTLVNGASAVHNVTVRNDGEGSLTIGIVTLSDTLNFTITSDGCSGHTLVGGGTCSIGVRFNPKSAGAKTGTLSIPSDDPDISEKIITVNLSGKGVFFTVAPVQGTLGTEITISGSGFGVKKAKVLVGSVLLKVLEWTDTSIRCLLTKTLSPGVYGVTVQPKGGSPLTEADAFEIKPPEIVSVIPAEGSEGEEIRIQGNFFGTKKGKVYLERDAVRKACKITGWTMTEVKFLVPKGLAGGPYGLVVENKVGGDEVIFEIQ